VPAPPSAFSSQRGRYYQWGEESFPSVTTIIGNVLRPYLQKWAADQVAKYAVQNADIFLGLIHRGDPEGAQRWLAGAALARSGAAMKRGSAIHAAAEAYANGLDLPKDPDIAPYVRQFERWVEEFDPAYRAEEIEFTVFSRKHGYAGTADAIVDIDGQRFLVDYKSADAGKTPYADVALQLSAYRYADFIGRDHRELPMPQVDRTAVLHITPERYLFVPVDTGDGVFQVFRACAFIYQRWLEEMSKQVMGAPMQPVAA
jgi:hypothetical protein